MVDFTDGTTAGVVTKEVAPNTGVKIIQVKVPETFVWATDSLIVDLGDYGASKITGFLAFIDSTEGSIVVAGTGTTSVSSGVLTIDSVGSSAVTKTGTFIIFAY